MLFRGPSLLNFRLSIDYTQVYSPGNYKRWPSTKKKTEWPRESKQEMKEAKEEKGGRQRTLI